MTQVDIGWAVPIGRGAITYLTRIVSPPAVQAGIHQDGTGMPLAHRDGRCVVSQVDYCRYRSTGQRTIAQLPVAVIPPAGNLSGVEESAAVE